MYSKRVFHCQSSINTSNISIPVSNFTVFSNPLICLSLLHCCCSLYLFIDFLLLLHCCHSQHLFLICLSILHCSHSQRVFLVYLLQFCQGNGGNIHSSRKRLIIRRYNGVCSNLKECHEYCIWYTNTVECLCLLVCPAKLTTGAF